MDLHTSINRNLIVISLLSTLLIFVLSTVFWIDAYVQRKGAVQLQSSTAPEHTLFDLASSLDTERSLQHAMLSATSSSQEEINSLRDATSRSQELMQSAIEQITKSRQIESRFIQHSYGPQAIEISVKELSDGFDRMQQISWITMGQIAKPPLQRREFLRMQHFDAYSNLIRKVNSLRHRTQYFPARKYNQVLAVDGLKDSVWNLKEAVLQNSSLLHGYLVKSENNSLANIEKAGVLFRTYQQSQIAEDAVFEIKEFIEGQGESSYLGVQLGQLLDLFESDYKPAEKKLVRAIDKDRSLELSSSEWQLAYSGVQAAIDKLSAETVSKTMETANDIKNSASRTLLLDTVLVWLCIGMAVVSTGIAKRVQHQATHDDLTQLPNRRYFSQALLESIGKADQASEKVALLTVDLNRFKAVNDTMGHAVGDSLLSQVSERLTECAGDNMLVSRMGGDEFAMLIQSCEKYKASKVAENIIRQIDAPFKVEDGLLSIGSSIGVSFYPEDGQDSESLQMSSDHAMFTAKRQSKKDGKSNVQFFNDKMAQEFENRARIERDLVIAIETNQLELYYQPQFNLNELRVDGVEALIRWQHPENGMVSPVQFIPVAEECGLMPALGAWVLEAACRQAGAWQNEQVCAPRVAINVSVHQLTQPGFADNVIETLERHKLNSKSIEIELTESVFMDDDKTVINALTKLADVGIKIALDDFGTGYSSFSQLQNLPINTLKIDRSFISRLDGEKKAVSHSVTATIASIAGILGLETVAEGVESDTQLQEVSELGIDIVQGYYYSKPVPGSDIPATIAGIDGYSDQAREAA